MPTTFPLNQILIGAIAVVTLVAGTVAARDGDDTGPDARHGPPPVSSGLSAQTGFDYTRESRFRRETDQRQDARQFHAKAGYLFALRENVFVSSGLRYRHFAFSSTSLPLPENLYEISVPLELTIRQNRRPLYSLLIRPALGFEDSITGQAVQGSFLAYRSFGLNEDLSVQVALFGSTSGKYPVLPGLGLTWRFSEQGILLLTPPRPGIRYSFGPDWSLFVGGSFDSGTFRVAEKDGVPKGSRLNYTEFRTAGELTRRLGESLQLKGGLGWMIKRKFDHDRIGVVHRTRGAPFATLAVEALF